MARPVIHHRTPEFRELLLGLRRNLQEILRTGNDIVVLASSGTGAMEAAVSSLLNRGETAVAVVAGKFGRRWVELCESHAVKCAPLQKELGDAASAAEIVRKLEETPEAKALLIQGCETSTATSHDLEAIGAEVIRRFPEVLIIVDGITAVGSQIVETDSWNLDVVISGSQKAFGMSPGLAFLSLSPRALLKAQSGGAPRYYFDLAKEAIKQRDGQSSFTPAVTLVEALRASTDAILGQGLDSVVDEAGKMARATRAGLAALGFRPLSKHPSNAATAAFPPEGVSAFELSKRLESRFQLKVAGGQDSLKGKIIRIAHLGYFDMLDMFSVLTAVELCVSELGVVVQPGTAVRAAIEATNLTPAGVTPN